MIDDYWSLHPVSILSAILGQAHYVTLPKADDQSMGILLDENNSKDRWSSRYLVRESNLGSLHRNPTCYPLDNPSIRQNDYGKQFLFKKNKQIY